MHGNLSAFQRKWLVGQCRSAERLIEFLFDMRGEAPEPQWYHACVDPDRMHVPDGTLEEIRKALYEQGFIDISGLYRTDWTPSVWLDANGQYCFARERMYYGQRGEETCSILLCPVEKKYLPLKRRNAC